MFTLTTDHLRHLWGANHFDISDAEWLFFGLRGCIPANDTSTSFADQHVLIPYTIDYTHPRCTIGQFKPDGSFALFPGSTVPHQRNVATARDRNGRGTNQLMTGFHPDYRKGWHKAGKPTGHKAFRQDSKIPIRRSGDDLDYDTDDRVEYTTPYDNLHAAWCMSTDDDRYASAGCQVIVGYPRCEGRANRPDVGPWRTFLTNAYDIPQTSFGYILLSARDAIAVSSGAPTRQRLRFGSSGSLVSEVQQLLKDRAFYEGRIDGDFGRRTLFAVLAFQEAMFGPQADDGIVGPITASALGLQWP